MCRPDAWRSRDKNNEKRETNPKLHKTECSNKEHYEKAIMARAKNYEIKAFPQRRNIPGRSLRENACNRHVACRPKRTRIQ